MAVDSLDLANLQLVVEEEFQIKIKNLNNIDTIGDLINLIEKKIVKKNTN